MLEADLQLLLQAAEKAGDLATGFFRGKNEVWHKANHAGPVSEADLAVDQMLRESLTDARPDYGWLSEETEDSDKRQNTDRVFIVDPIDGTRSFIEGHDTWAHSLAIADKGQVIAAVVFLPALGKLYAATPGQGATLNGEAITVAATGKLSGSNILAARPMMEPSLWPGGVPEVKRHHRPSLAYRQCLVAEGRFDAMLTLRPSWEWDIAAGSLILAEAGATVTDRKGAALCFNNPHPQTDGVVAAGEAVHHDLMAGLGIRTG